MLDSTFSIEYQKGRESGTADALSQVTLTLDTEIVDAQDPVVAKADEDIHKPVKETAVLDRAAQTHVDLHVND